MKQLPLVSVLVILLALCFFASFLAGCGKDLPTTPLTSDISFNDAATSQPFGSNPMSRSFPWIALADTRIAGPGDGDKRDKLPEGGDTTWGRLKVRYEGVNGDDKKKDD